ncbi:plasma membrane localization protein [Conoideocrella luteorostrata]|uniref:Plasma membrane localization protein n=1 Tax=Conoideocrella luteorostrata TaxID=1105319 RepID=A0AAJ0CPQ4_9HYPO|nr:plasma membrane localization protein [Conoideocrella luteorostrata]
MNAIQDKCRPKHQVLVLKCYPKTTKGDVDVVPNSSELSYLLFYATSRRSKIQKIGAFLEKKTANDVWRMRIGNVQVTLGILAALVEKSPKEAALIAPCVLKILDLILRSDDITMVESSLPTFEAFCDHHDVSSLFGDSAYLQQYQSVVRSYAQLASTRHVPTKGPVSKPLQFRWRNAGLEAIKHVASSDALSSVSGRQIDVIVPMILENMWTDEDGFLDILLQRVQTEVKGDPEKFLHRRSSITTVRTTETSGDANPVAFSGTALDVDNLAEEETGVFATRCLKSIFVVPNRAQIYGATNALLKFVSKRVAEGSNVMAAERTSGRDVGWAITIYDIISRWTPVQDRYVILLATLDMLNKTPMREENLRQHVTFTAMMQSLLRSDVNLIGLSVMDVLLGLIRQVKKLFELHKESSHESSQSDDRTDTELEIASRSQRNELLERLEDCTSDLANHVYYADQVSDMISALFSRIKHSRSASVTSLPYGADKGDNGADATAASPGPADLTGSQALQDTCFSHSAGRLSALRIIKAILLLASPKTGISGNIDLSRNRVPLQAWEGTEWLLRDPDGHVRKSYVDAVTTWLDREIVYKDLVASDDAVISHRSTKNGRDISNSRRAVSSTSNRERQPRVRRCQFLPLLHLAIYDSASQFVDYDNDIVLLHSLLTKLTFKLGVNAARCGIPMIYRLQEDIQELEHPIHKVRIASLCHGYFWALAEKFDFEGSVVGRAVYNEIVRRKNKGFWVQGVHVPAPTPTQIGTPGHTRPQPNWDLSALETEEILPFDDRASMVECIATSYQDANLSPLISPAASPNRSYNGPILGLNPAASGATHDESPELPPQFKEHMLSDWSGDSALAAITAAGKAESLNGSRTGTTGTTQNRLTINTGGAGLNGNTNGHQSPSSPHLGQPNVRPHTTQTQGDRLTSVSKLRKSSAVGRLSPSGSASSKVGIASVEQLKMMLSGTASPQSAGIPGAEDDSDDSMISCEYSASETSFNPAAPLADTPSTTGEALARSISASASFRGPLSSNPTAHDGGPSVHTTYRERDDVPPVPPLPNLSSLSSKIGMHSIESPTSKRNVSSRGGESVQPPSIRFREESSKSMDLQELLRGIDSRSGEGSLGNITKPPY